MGNRLDPLFSSARADWETPDDLFEELNEQFHFTLDAAATYGNTKVDRFIAPPGYFGGLTALAGKRIVARDGLTSAWGSNERVWLNPPYGRQASFDWVAKAFEECLHNRNLVVMLMPARTDTRWFQQFVWAPSPVDLLLVRPSFKFLPGRLKFGGAKDPAPFPSMLVVFERVDALTSLGRRGRGVWHPGPGFSIGPNRPGFAYAEEFRGERIHKIWADEEAA